MEERIREIISEHCDHDHPEMLQAILTAVGERIEAELDKVQDWNLSNIKDYGDLGNMVSASELENFIYSRIAQLGKEER